MRVAERVEDLLVMEADIAAAAGSAEEAERLRAQAEGARLVLVALEVDDNRHLPGSSTYDQDPSLSELRAIRWRNGA